MEEPLKISNFIAQEMTLSNEEALVLDECIPIRSFSKGALLLKEGQVATESYFMVKGLVRSYYVIDGDERTTAFFSEGEAVASLTSYVNRTPASHYLACVEECILAVLNYEKSKSYTVSTRSLKRCADCPWKKSLVNNKNCLHPF